VFFICAFDFFLSFLILLKQLISQQLVSELLVETMAINASIATIGLVKFDGIGNFGLWQRRVKDLLVDQGLVKVLYEKTKKLEKMT
jgi:hypothetical protein